MSQNSKQRGSNVGFADFYTGRCPVSCEQCFVNYGEHAHLIKTMHPKWKLWARKMGWKGSAALIPQTPKPSWTHRKRSIFGPDGIQHPFFLRVCSMSESTFLPDWWAERIQQVWGDYCFFNATIRALAPKSVGGLGRGDAANDLHRLVVSVNAGHQRPELVKSQLTRTQRRDRARNCFGPRQAADFLAPRSLTDAGLKHLEDRVKYYRLRALPTIRPRFEPTAPVVITPLRYKGLFYVLAHARKYGMDIEVQTGAANAIRDCAVFGVIPIARPGRTVVRLWHHGDENGSPLSDEATTLVMRSGWYRAVPDWENEPFVCDRSGKGCGFCGLCASLDGTYGSDGWNRLNLIPPVAGADYYYPMDAPGAGRAPREEMVPMENPTQFDETVFGQFLETIAQGNPLGASVEEKSPEWLLSALSFLGPYYSDGGEEGVEINEGWNTWNEAEALLAYVWWCLLRQAIRQGMSPSQSEQWAKTFAAEASGVPNIGALIDELEDVELLWQDDGCWFEEFGSIHQ